MALFLPIIERAYIKSTPQKSANPASSGMDKLKSLALELVPQFDTSRLIIDVLSSEEHNLENVVPENPLEDGSYLHDHMANLPKGLTLECVFTDTPIDPIDPFYGRIDSGKGLIKKRFEKLESLRDDNEPVTVVTGLKVYSNMAIKSVKANKDNSGHKFTARIELVQLQIAASSTGESSTFAVEPDSSIEHGITAGQAIGAVALAAVTFG